MFTRHIVLSVLISAFFAYATAFAGGDDPQLEIGGGVLLNDLNRETSRADVLVRVSYDGHSFRGTRLYILRVTGEVAVPTGDMSQLETMDVEVLPVGFEERTDDFSFGAALGSLKIQRDALLDNGIMLRLALIGVRGEAKFLRSGELNAFVNGAADILGLGLTKRVSDVDTTMGMGLGAKIEAGMEWKAKLRIAAGHRHDRVDSRPVDYVTPYYTCHSGYQGTTYGNLFYCSNTATDYRQHTVRNESYLSLIASLAENLSVFGKMSYVVYDVSDEDFRDRNHRKDSFRLLVGMQVGI